MTSIKLKIVIWFMESFTIQGMITVSSVLIFLTQISESDLTNYDSLKQTNFPTVHKIQQKLTQASYSHNLFE